MDAIFITKNNPRTSNYQVGKRGKQTKNSKESPNRKIIIGRVQR